MGFIFYRGNATNIQNAEKVFHRKSIYCENDNKTVKTAKMCIFLKKKIALHLVLFGYNSNDLRCGDDVVSSVYCLFTIERKEPEMLKTIRLTPEDVKHFVDVASKCDFDIDICYNRYVIDAKSFLGVYGLDFTKPLTVSYDGYNDKFEEMLKQCAIAC